MRDIRGKIRFSSYQVIVISYFVATILGTLLLKLPFAIESGIHLSWLDALFTSMSAISVTGLTTVTIADTFTPFGVLIIMVLIQFGGIGLMTLGTFIWLLLGEKIGLRERKLMMIDHNRNDLAGLVRVMRFVLFFSLTIELVAGLIFGTYLWLKNPYEAWYGAYFHGIFHGISAFTNTGFDIFGNSSLINFRSDSFFTALTMLLIVMGGLGFPVLLELKAYLTSEHRHHFRFSLYTKVTTLVFTTIMIIGAISIFLLERTHIFADVSSWKALYDSLFYSVTARNAGFSISDVSQFSTSTLFFLSILMFIGASPSSVGGGIRTTTLFVILLTILQYARGEREINIFGRRIAHDDIIKSFVVFATAIILTGTMIILVDSIELHQHSLVEVIFEVTSAFGTTGLSMGITAELAPLSKILLIITMFIGRIGIVSFLLFFAHEKPRSYHYPEERLIIG
ncbi:TrkH family potassium uptake protein [Rubeoparvulum massiliense]|uniref:TrkH family potassium uptake protein n=1 Tax=Rubeoparvulum massiliense TaxID=1631346 RepID=UPI00065E7765|nr:potassium transporter TrkG [Rubeoparvulum massiliense]